MTQGPVARAIHEKLTVAFAPERLELVDDSARHAGHHHEGGIDARPGGESHFNLEIVAQAFAGLSRVERQRRINAALREELAGPVHALSIRALAPDEVS
ncbi:MAG TPA: BolA family protein [Brevundimonas sp.]|uniref:BolA family protein n=1 Tax=Brevundimonas sp. TaxID=1871086 RepID=UPI002E0FB85E|nr:BolA family protein [Brevundimonas sp.]